MQRVFHNGEHNAFTDLVRFKGDFYLTLRSCPDGRTLIANYSSHEQDSDGNPITASYSTTVEMKE